MPGRLGLVCVWEGARTRRAKPEVGRGILQCGAALMGSSGRFGGERLGQAGSVRGGDAEVMLPLGGKASHSQASPQSPAEESARNVLEGETRET